MKRRVNRIWKEIGPILAREWNPIGFPVPDDEYDCCIGPVCRILKRNPSAAELAQELDAIWPTDRERLRATVRALLKIDVSLDENDGGD